MMSTRISHQFPAAAGEAPHPAAFSRIGMLDGPPSTTPRPSGRKHPWVRRLAALATKPGEKCGLRHDDGRIRWGRLRRLSQVGVIVLFIGLPFTYKLGQTSVMGSLASLKVGPISLVDPVSGLASMIAMGESSWALLGGLLLPLLLALTLGPVFCSWVCPWGFLSEMLDRLLRRRVTRIQSWLGPLRWSFLGVVLILGLATGMPLATTLSPPRLMSILPMEIIFLGGATAGTLVLFGIFFVLECVLPRRLWCRALCPVGSTLVALRLRKTLTPLWTEPTCRPELQGATCFVHCPWNLDPRYMSPLDGCTNCGTCIESCPSGPSLRFSFGRSSQSNRTLSEESGLPVLD